MDYIGTFGKGAYKDPSNQDISTEYGTGSHGA